MTRTYLVTVVCLALQFGCSEKSAPAAAAPSEVAPAPPQAAAAPAAQDPTQTALLGRAELGKVAPDFTLTDTEGKTHTLSALKGKTVVLEWFNPDCPFVKFAHGQGELEAMAEKVMGESLIWLSINSGAPGKQGHGVDRNRAAKGEYGMKNAVLLDESGAVGKSYDAQKTPHLFIVDKAGMLIYRGAIDNAPIGKVDPERPKLPTSKEDDLVNYVDAALQDVRSERSLRLADTPPYGCSVKYRS